MCCAPAASYVFLLEPSLNVAVEQQALARVHRFGQTRPVRIVRFICHDTVEVNLCSGSVWSTCHACHAVVICTHAIHCLRWHLASDPLRVITWALYFTLLLK